jgi:hypothetical protein
MAAEAVRSWVDQAAVACSLEVAASCTSVASGRTHLDQAGSNSNLVEAHTADRTVAGRMEEVGMIEHEQLAPGCQKAEYQLAAAAVDTGIVGPARSTVALLQHMAVAAPSCVREVDFGRAAVRLEVG